MVKIMVIEGNVKRRREGLKARFGMTTGESYGGMLKSLDEDVEFMLAHPTDKDWDGRVGDYEGSDGAVITGSSLHVGDRDENVERQISFVRDLLLQGVPIFGSCWGLQVLVVSAGGVVAENVKGREVGVGRRVRVTSEGRGHGMYEGKGDEFDVVSVHTDHVVSLPEGSRVLASNDMSEVQALEIEGQGAVCWGVQYHPEFSLGSMADILEGYGPATVRVGVFPDKEAVERLISDLRAVDADSDRMDLRRLYGWGEDIVDSCVRMRELKNWLEKVVKPGM